MARASNKITSQKEIAKHVDWFGKVDAKALKEGCYFDLGAANHVCNFFEQYLVHSKGRWAGKPFILQQWQRRLLMRLFGWKRPDGFRRFQTAYIEIPKKNGKSAIASGVAIYLLAADGEPVAEIYSVAVDRIQAGIVFDEAKRAILASPKLRDKFTILKNTIVHRASQSKYEVLSGIAANADGKNIHGLLFDELHRQKTRDLFDTLRYGGAARQQPLLLSITTAGHDRTSICFEQHEYARRVNEGSVLDTSFFGFIAAADEKDDWTKPTTWKKANPSWGIVIDEGKFARECQEAQDSPLKENTFKRYRLNLWTEQETRWLSLDKWLACENKEFDWDALEGQSCFAGVDLGLSNDLSACVLLFPTPEGFAIKPYFWCCEDSGGRKRHPMYADWAKNGLITITEGNVTDFERIKQDIVEMSNTYNIDKLAIDPMNATHFGKQLYDEGIDVEFFRQNFGKMNEPTQTLERWILSKRVFHDGNACMTWQSGNVVIDTDNFNNVRMNKKKSPEKIDGFISLVMATGLAMQDADASSYTAA